MTFRDAVADVEAIVMLIVGSGDEDEDGRSPGVCSSADGECVVGAKDS
jgi:hypothetical protein